MTSSELRWYIGLLGDGTYRFITPDSLEQAEIYIGKNGGAVFSHAGYLIFASDRRWWDWIDGKREKKFRGRPEWEKPPHIDVPNIECTFSQQSLDWLERNEEELKNLGGKYYEFIPRH